MVSPRMLSSVSSWKEGADQCRCERGGEGKDTGECRAPEMLRSDPHATQDHAGVVVVKWGLRRTAIKPPFSKKDRSSNRAANNCARKDGRGATCAYWSFSFI